LAFGAMPVAKSPRLGIKRTFAKLFIFVIFLDAKRKFMH